MKKTVLVLTLAALCTGVHAQKKNVNSAKEYLQYNNYKKAIPVIEEAVNSEETKNYAEAWYVRGMVYYQQAIDTTANAPAALDEATKSFLKALTLKPDFSSDINIPLYATAIQHFNKGVGESGDKHFDNAYNEFIAVYDIYKAGGKRYTADATFTKQAESARLNAGLMALNAKKYPEAQVIFNDLKEKQNPKEYNTYQYLVEIYQNQKNEAQMTSTLSEARKLWPDSSYFRDLELNYYIQSGKTDVLMGKFEEALQKDPNNALLTFNLANLYEKMAFPKDAQDKDLPRPANFDDVYKKAETTYEKAIQLSPDNVDYNYNAGTLYFNNAVDMNKRMNALGTSAAEQKKYDAIMAQRNGEFKKAVTYFEKAYAVLSAKGSNITPDEKDTFRSVIYALKNIYGSQSNKAKLDELKKKEDELK